MTPPAAAPTPFGVIGVFVLMLGTGVILDADRTIWGYGLIVAGAVCLGAEWRRGSGS